MVRNQSKIALSYSIHFFLKFWISLLVFITLHTNTKAQTSEQPQQLPVADSSEILALITKGKSLTSTEPDKAILYFNQAYSLSVRLHYIKGQAQAAKQIGFWYFGNNVNTAITHAVEAAHIFEKENVGTLDDKAETHMLLAESYDEKGQQDSSAYYYYLLSNEVENGKIQDPVLAVDFYTKLAVFWLNLNYDVDAGEGYWQTIRSFINKAKLVTSQTKDSTGSMYNILFLQGAYYHGRKEFDSARYYYTQYIDKREKLKNLPLLRKISTLVNIADTYLKQEKPTEALRYIYQIEQIGSAPEQKKFLAFFMTFVNLMKAQALYQLKEYQASIDLAEENLKDLQTTGDHLREEVVTAYKTLADSYEAIGNYQQALKYKNIFIQLDARLNKVEKMDIIKRQEIHYRMADNDKKLAEQQLTISGVEATIRQRNLIIICILLLLFSSTAFFILWRNRNLEKQKLQQASIHNLQSTMEIERLNAAIAGEERERTRIARDLHDGVGGLLSAAKMNLEFTDRNINDTGKEDLNTSIKLIQEASAELRKAAHNMMPGMLLEDGLAVAIKKYCETNYSKSSTSFICQTVGISQKLTPSFELSVYRIIQELLHNIVKHAMAANALVQLDFIEDGGLNITVEDDGIGLAENAKTEKNGMGLKSTADRVKALKGKIDIMSSLGKGTSIYIEFEQTQYNYQPA